MTNLPDVTRADLRSALCGPHLHIASGRGLDRPAARRPELRRSRNRARRLLPEPLGPIRPPAAGDLPGSRQPAFGLGTNRAVDPVAPLLARGRIDDAGDVAACAEHE